MSTISFIERFKRQEHKKKTDNHYAEKTKLLRLIQSLNQISASDVASDKLTNMIFNLFNCSGILLSTPSPIALKVNRYWVSPKYHSSDIADNIIGKPANELCEQTRKNRSIHLVERIENSDDPMLTRLNAKSYIGFPVFDDDNQVIAVLSVINGQENYSTSECEALSSMAERIYHEIQLPNSPTDTQQNTPSAIPDSRLQSELDTANQCLESISYTISHDLRAPLRSIDSFSAILSEEFSEKLSEDAIDNLARIRRATKRMGNLIDDLLSLAKVTRRKLDIQEIDLTKAANKVLNELREEHKEYNCEFQAEPHLLVNADKHLMKIVLKNLLGNACKFSQHREKIQISFDCFQQNNQMVYRLTDNGSGFDMMYSDQIFEPFKRLHEGREFKGTGIGLATAQRIIQRHSGKIWIESEPNEGTSVFFTLGVDL